MIQRRAEDVAGDVATEDAVIQQLRETTNPETKATLTILHNISRGLRDTNRLVAEVFDRLDKQDKEFATHAVKFDAHARAEDKLFQRALGAYWVMSLIGAAGIGLGVWFVTAHLKDMEAMQGELRAVKEDSIRQAIRIKSVEEQLDSISTVGLRLPTLKSDR